MVRANERTAAFEAERTARPGNPTWFNHAVVMMIEPPSRMIGSTAWIEKNADFTFVSMRRSYCASLVVDKGVP